MLVFLPPLVPTTDRLHDGKFMLAEIAFLSPFSLLVIIGGRDRNERAKKILLSFGMRVASPHRDCESWSKTWSSPTCTTDDDNNKKLRQSFTDRHKFSTSNNSHS